MRRIKEQTNNAIRGAFTDFILTADINLKGYSGPQKTIKLKWENNAFKCEEEGN